MQQLLHSVKQRLVEEYHDFDIPLPRSLEIILDNELYYLVTLLVILANAFALGMLIGFLYR